MAYNVTLTQFVISDISINADPAQLTTNQETVKMHNEASFTCRPPVNPDDATAMLECNFKMRSDGDTLVVNLSASGIFRFDSIPDSWLEAIKEYCTHPMVDACKARVENILKEMGMALKFNK